MLEELLAAYASSPTLEPEAMRFLSTQARAGKDVDTLAVLAARSDLPQDVDDLTYQIAGDILEVRVARLRRTAVAQRDIDAALADKRVSVAVALAQAPGLPQSVYQHLAKPTGTSVKAAIALLGNPSADQEARVTAIATACASMNHLNGPHSDALKLAVNSAPDMTAVATAVLAATDNHQARAMMIEDSRVPQELLDPVIAEALDWLEAYDWSGVNWDYRWMHEHGQELERRMKLVSGACQFQDLPAALRQRAAALHEAHTPKVPGRSPWAGGIHRSATRVRSGQGRIKAPSIDELLAIPDLRSRLEALTTDHLDALSDDEYVRVICERSYSLDASYNGGYQGFDQLVADQLSRYGDNPARVVALLSRVMLKQATIDAVRSQIDVPAAMAHLGRQWQSLTTPGQRLDGTAVTSGLFHAAHTLDPQGRLVPLLPVTIVDWVTPGKVRNLCCPEARAPLAHAAGAHLWEQFGDDCAAWQAFSGVFTTMDLTLGEAIAAAKDTAHRAA